MKLATSEIPFKLALLLAFGVVASEAVAQDLLVSRGAQWTYWDAGVEPALDWQQPGFDDANWSLGAAQLGYGDGDETTVVSFGANSSAKHITTYFRRSFTASESHVYAELELLLQRDDGAVVYLNGTEVVRDNMPAGTITSATRASAAAGAGAESAFNLFVVPVSHLIEGTNVLAVEIHQSSPTSSDISFDLELSGRIAPIAISLVAPMLNSTNATLDMNLAVTIENQPGSDITVEFLGRNAPPMAGPDFTLIALPDTQYYTGTKNGGDASILMAQMEWIKANQASRNIAFVTQLGDCVENGDNGGDPSEWLIATNAFYQLEAAVSAFFAFGIPYGIAVGNHDQSPFGAADGTSVFYNQFFGADHFAGRDYYGGHHGDDNDNHYELFSASGLDFVILHLEYDASPNAEVLAWADNVLQMHPTRRAIIVSHYLIEKGSQASFGTQGQAVYDALKHHSNLFLMLSGHVPGEGQRVDVFNGNTVHTLLSDYQGRANGGDGWLRILEFSPNNNQIRVRTYSPTLDQYETDADSEFTLDHTMNPGDPFEPLGTMVLDNGATQAVLPWNELNPGAEYEWCVAATDGQRAGLSDLFRFATDGQGEAGAPLPTVSIHATSPLLGEQAESVCDIILSRQGNLESPLTVALTITGSAEEGSDFMTLPREVLFPIGVDSVTFHLLPIQDDAMEGFEDVVLSLTPSQGCILDPNFEVRILIADQQSDADLDGQSDAQEVRAGTDPSDAGSSLKITSIQVSPDAVSLQWTSIPGKTYRVHATVDLGSGTWTLLGEPVLADDVMTGLSHPRGQEEGRQFYVVEVMP